MNPPLAIHKRALKEGREYKEKVIEVSNLLGVNAQKSRVAYDTATGTYTIQPKSSKESLELESLKLEKLHLYSLCFCRCRFTQPLEFKGEATKKKSIKSLVFEECIFEQSVNFSYCEFEEFICKYAKFRENVYFESAQFKRLELCNNDFTRASFCNVVFLNPPKIYDNQFEKHANFSGARCEKSLDELKEFIQQECKKENITGKNDTQQNIRKQEILNQYSESFRIYKSVFIASDSLSDVSKYYKYELYLKEMALENEIEIDILKNKNVKSVKPSFMQKIKNEYSKPSHDFSKTIECLMLKFYRHTSEHYTSLARIVNFSAWMVVVHALFFYGVILLEPFLSSLDSLRLTAVYVLASVIIMLFCCIIMRYASGYKISLASLLFGLCVCFVLSYTWLFENQTKQLTFFMLLAYMITLTLAYSIFICKNNFIAITFRLALYIAFFVVLISAPQLLSPLVSNFRANDLLHLFQIETLTPSIATTFYLIGMICFLILNFCVFSLQKTARKNSIIPK
ncbi:hypothetical protein CQA49_05490 [Helicobacter sp. MIT 00-7814]|uniref:hypothetical protein n=1 Tax=unclassified Helicobacter TaxID=2593540 RepID=UPI000E1EDDCD|nr:MULTISPECIES: hypothetical protein [unclassified Helicobacter]RDU54239.1 hypothetical protein CQA49_05490 [Helicobacter sp. MIT 00-7814]RDU56015.1 hypothetical protein CQA37_02930 [Helicobacter sp. MIT 99-10781]